MTGKRQNAVRFVFEMVPNKPATNWLSALWLMDEPLSIGIGGKFSPSVPITWTSKVFTNTFSWLPPFVNT